ncbi:SDR family NAD(P)-dependent oxidoreductase [Lentzea sp. NPDC034063]|uniref:SDR family NAD(P)-dependent oxidoreductase n=1 Tax=unclassified Lentzea TaxID=2643253 RepID=UPI0033F5BA6F
MSKIWFITGASRGLGRTWAVAALQRGDKVAAAVRNPAVVKDLVDTYGDAFLPVRLDVTDRVAAFNAVQQAHAHFGRLDVVMNNAGYAHWGFLEEITESEVRAQFDVNLFGALWVSQAAIPLMRRQGSGHIVQISSVGGVTAFPTLGAYNASKWALEGFTEALAQEVEAFGIRTTVIEPGGYATEGSVTSAVHSEHLPAYQTMRDDWAAALAEAGQTMSDPAVTTAAVFAAIDAEQPPRRLLLSGSAFDIVQGVYAERLKTWADWETVSRSA